MAGPARGVRIAARAADLVAVDADRSRALVGGGGARGDVAAGLRPVRVARSREREVGRVRAARAGRARCQVLQRVAALAEALPVAAAAQALVGARLDLMPAQEVGAVDEVGGDPL